MTRRLLLRLGGLFGLLLATGAALPPLLYWRRSANLQSDGAPRWVPLGPAGKLPEGEWLEVPLRVERRNRWRLEYGREALYVRRRGREIRVLSSVCPHADCLVRLEEGGFSCPCHRSSFDSEGRVLDGPSPRALKELPWRVEKGTLVVEAGGRASAGTGEREGP